MAARSVTAGTLYQTRFLSFLTNFQQPKKIKKTLFFTEKQLTELVILRYIEYILNEGVLNIEPKRTEGKKAGRNSGCRIRFI